VFTAIGPLTPSAGFLLAGESLLDLIGIAGQGIVGFEHREAALASPAPHT